MPEAVTYHSLQDVVVRANRLFPDTRFFLSKDPAMPYVLGRELYRLCGRLGSKVRHGGMQGAHIALLGPNCAAWISAYFAVVSGGCTAVPMHLGTPDDELASCLARADVSLLLYDAACQAQADALQRLLPELQMQELHTFLQELNTDGDLVFPELKRDGMAALYFTSGTTAQSKCVILTHGNMGAHCTTAMAALPLSLDDAGLSILPPSHTFELMTNIVGALHCGGTLYINESLRTVKRNLQKYQPTILVVVPLVLQTLHKEILNTARRQGKLEKLQKGLKLSGALQAVGIDISRRLFQDVYDVLGHNLRYFLCGGAALDPELIRFFKCLGITVLQGYGITECSPIVAANLPGANRIGSIGRAFPCCETAIIDGEICVRGGSVSPGYYRDEAATAESYRDGWFHTGDLGRMDRRGFLYFQGRAKNLIVLANGENVSPEELETRLYQLDGVRDAIVYEKHQQITAEVYADPAVFPDAAALWQAVSEINRHLPPYKQIGNLIYRENEFEKTATQKIKRRAATEAAS